MKNLLDLKIMKNKDSQPEWLESMQKDIIDPMTNQNCKFQGYSLVHSKNGNSGLHILIFEGPIDADPIIPIYEDGDAQIESFSYNWMGTIYICIPMPV